MSAVEQLKRYVRETITPDEVIMALLSQLNADSIPKDPAKIHSAIYHLKKEKEYQDFLCEFQFDVSGLSPFSELLDRVLFRLETTSLIGTLNPRYEKYTTLKKDLMSTVIPKFPESRQLMLKKISKEFEQLIGV